MSVLIPLIFPFPLEPEITPPVRKVYNFVEALPPGSIAWLGFDYYADTTTECDPQAYSITRHLFRRDIKIIATSLIPDGASISQRVLNDVAQEYDRSYGKDYVILGYKAGQMVAIKQMCQDFWGIFPKDVLGRPVMNIPLMQRVRDYRDIDFIFTITDGTAYEEFVAIASTGYRIPMAGGTTAVSVPQLYPFLDSGQAIGLLGGIRGGAEYEKLVGIKGTAAQGMASQSVVHLVISFLIVFSNIAYFVNRKKTL